MMSFWTANSSSTTSQPAQPMPKHYSASASSPPTNSDNILRELQHLSDEYRNGTFLLDTQYEDGHSAIESRLTERLGDTGRKIHTGRSRNDQILVATRLWLKDRLTQLSTLNRDIAHHALQRAAAEQHLPMPGYTHLQRAVVSSAGMWWAGWAESFIDNALRAADTLALIDCNPSAPPPAMASTSPGSPPHHHCTGLCTPPSQPHLRPTFSRQI